MSHYYFDIFDGRDLIRDEEGQDCATLAIARNEAEEATRELAATVISRHAAMDSRELRVRDSGGAVVLIIGFREVLEG